jgi:DNA repair photolyase
VRWDAQRTEGAEVAGTDVLPGMPGLLRTVRSPDFADVVFHEVAARSLLNRVPGGSSMPFGWTVNPYRGCSHACTYCFARGTHAYLELDTGRDFDSQVVVKVNAAEVLARETSRPGWAREHVAMGTNTDPYQRAEGRYALMPGIIAALHRSRTPFSILTKGTVLRRDLDLVAAAARDVPVGIGVSLALLDPELHATLEPGTPSPRARLALVRSVREAGLPCGVFVAPVLPHLTDSVAQLDALLGEVAAAGATGVTMVALHLRPGTRAWFLAWLGRTRPDLVERYEQLYAGGAYADRAYRQVLARRWQRLAARHGLRAGRTREPGADPGADDADFPPGALPQLGGPRVADPVETGPEQLTLL